MKTSKEKINECTKKRYHRLKNEGVCVCCGFRKATNNTTKCDECRKLVKQYQANRRLRLIEEGLCVNCGKPLNGSINLTCQVCTEKNIKKTKEYTKKHREKVNQKRREKYRKEVTSTC